MIKGRKLSSKEVSEIISSNPFWQIDRTPLVLKSYKDGRKRMFANINNKKYLIREDKYHNDEWFEVIDES